MKKLFNYYFTVLKKYAVLKGRARREEFWYFYLANFIIGFLLGFIDGFFGISGGAKDSILANIYQLVILVPTIAVGVRRIHDVGKSGWFILIPIYNFILAVTNGTKGENKYGPDPKELNQ